MTFKNDDHQGTRRMQIRTIAILLLLPLSGCSEQGQADKKMAGQEVQFEKFVGHWEAKAGVAGDASGFDNTAIIFGKDGMVEYRHCARSAGIGGTQSTGQVLSKLVVSEIGNGSLSLSKPATPYYAEKKFVMGREPHEENGHWYLELDGLALRKLDEGESSDYLAWQCPQ